MKVIIIRESRLDALVDAAINRLKVQNRDIDDSAIGELISEFAGLRQALLKDEVRQ